MISNWQISASLLISRLLIGAFEAGFYPTAVAYLALFYYPFELGARIGLFYGLYVVANAFSGAMGRQRSSLRAYRSAQGC